MPPRALIFKATIFRPFFLLAMALTLFMSPAHVLRGAARGQAEDSAPHLSWQEMSLYHNARTLIDWTPRETRAVRELRGLRPSESQQDLAPILRGVEDWAAKFFDELPNVSCTESVQSGPCPVGSNQCAVTFESKFQYLVLARSEAGTRLMTEYRTDAKGRPIDYQKLTDVPILTYGFATAPLEHFNPPNRAASRFRYFGRQMVDGKETDVVGFAEIPEKYDKPTELTLQNHNVALFLQGLAWIDAETYEVLRIQTFLLAPRPDIGLEELTAVINYGAVRLPETATAFRLPEKVVVTAVFEGEMLHRYQVRNVHRYSDYKLFRVETRISPEPKK